MRATSGPPGENPKLIVDPTTLAVHALIHNTGTEADRLIGCTSEVCSSSYMQDKSVKGPPDFETVPFISIPAGSNVELKFTGLCIVCSGISGVKLGDRVPFTLIFEKYGEVKVMIEIRDNPG